MRFLKTFLPTAVGLSVSQVAHAVTHTVCVEADISFSDHTTLHGGHDFLANDGPTALRGAALLVTQATQPPLLTYTDTNGGSPGCATIDVVEDFTVTVLGEVVVGGNEATVRDSSTGSAWTHSFGLESVGGPTSHDYVLPVSRKWNILAVTAHALFRSDAGRTSARVEFYTTDAGGTLHSPCGGSCIRTRNDSGPQLVSEIYIPEVASYKKMLIAYTVGRALANDMGIPTLDFSEDDTHCGSSSGALTLASIEKSGAGVVEGFAHFYSATAFNRNNPTNTTCPYPYWRDVNWDRLAYPCYVEDEAPAGHLINCMSGPKLAPLLEIVPERDHRQYCQDRSPGYDLMTQQPNTVVPLDVLRLFFDLAADGSLSIGRADVGAALATSLPWSGVSMVDELEAAFVSLGLLSTSEADARFVEHGLK